MEQKLETFLTLCRTMHYGRAAEALNLSQPAVSKHIQSLEEEYGAPLFTYANRRLRKTRQGELLEQYAMSAARWVQLEGINSQYGFITKTAQGVVTASPFVAQAQAYMKQTNQLWYQIYQIVKENCSTTFDGTPQDDLMERLLKARDGDAEKSTGR